MGKVIIFCNTTKMFTISKSNLSCGYTITPRRTDLGETTRFNYYSIIFADPSLLSIVVKRHPIIPWIGFNIKSDVFFCFSFANTCPRKNTCSQYFFFIALNFFFFCPSLSFFDVLSSKSLAQTSDM